MLLKKTGCAPEVIQHSKEVCHVAEKIAKLTNADINLVKAGALLHDIGRCKTDGIYHAIKGAHLAKTYGLPESIINIIERHIGAGISPEIAQKLHLPRKDYRPKTLEEKIVCHADNLIDDSKRQTIEDEVQKALIEGKKEYAIDLIKLHKELSDLCGIDLNKI
jgi:uncharacterized protein (TIGR00295 family)